MANDASLKRTSLELAERHVRRAERRYVDQDPLKLGIEPNIRPIVIALVAHGFPTQNSCEGHLDGNLYPWVRLQPRTKGRTKKAILSHVGKIHDEMYELTKLLSEFRERGPSRTPDRELQVSPEWDPSIISDEQVVESNMAMREKRFVALPGYWLQCAGSEMLLTMPSELLAPHKHHILWNRQQDMLSFAEFLRSKL